MNHCVPSFDIDKDYSIPSASLPTNKANLEDDGIVELLWQNGQVVMQRQKSVKKSSASDLNGDELNNSSRREIYNQSHQQQQHLFMQEDEMASWLHYPLNHAAFDNDFCSDLLYSPAPCVSATVIKTEAPAASTETTTTTTATRTASAHHASQLAEQSKAKVWPRPPAPNLKPPAPSKDRKRKVRELDDANFFDEITNQRLVLFMRLRASRRAAGLVR